MSTDFYAYIGAYLQIKETHVIDEQEKFVCPSCVKSIETKFCPDCGEPPISMISKVSNPVHLNYLLEEVDDKFTSLFERNDIVIFNCGNIFSRTVGSFAGDDIIDHLPEKATEEDFKEAIEILKANNIEYELKHCIITYYA
jgi:hypothetical protein